MTSTLSGLTSKTEKQKGKFQSLDINKIYKSSRGESSEKQQQKSVVTYKHGMQILGKVPSTRRAPANLPSLKSEHSGTDAAVPLVPTGGPGWGKQDQPDPVAVATTATPAPPPTTQTSHQQAIALPVTSTIPYPQKAQPPAVADKSWSTVMTSGDGHAAHPPPFQGPQFNHEFPSLNGAAEPQPAPARPEPAYPSGLSLRPQTEGSWIGGVGPDAAKQGPALGAPPQLRPQPPQQQPFPPQYRGVMPPFMFKGNMPTNGLNMPNSMPPSAMNERNSRAEGKPHPKSSGFSDLGLPSIIKEEELHRMDKIEKEMNWAYQDDIDYNQKLAFSDDEIDVKPSKKDDKPAHHHHEPAKPQQAPKKQQQQHHDARQPAAPPRESSSEDDDMKARRNQQAKEIELAVERAKQRKQEEEKRFETTKQGANKKLKELEERISRRERGDEDSNRTINPTAVPSKIIAPPAEIPLPDFQKDKEPPIVKEKEDKSPEANTFKQMTQIDAKNIVNRKNVKNEPMIASFSRQFQSNLPPRFKKQQHNLQNMQPPTHYELQFQIVPKKMHPDSDQEERRPKENYEFKKPRESPEKEEIIKVDETDKPKDAKAYERYEKRHPEKKEPKPAKEKSSFDSFAAWGDTKFEIAFEEKRQYRDDRRVVPGPITKDRIEADDLRNEKRHLTQLKKGQMPEKKVAEPALAQPLKEAAKSPRDEKKDDETKSKPVDVKKRGDKAPAQGKPYGQKGPWDYRQAPGAWPKRPYGKAGKPDAPTDSEGSAEEPHDKNRPKKDDKRHSDRKGEAKPYVPRGEPSRHGRGGANVRGRVGLSKRIDGYGPPPSKSPFSNQDEKRPEHAEPAVGDDRKSDADKADKLNAQRKKYAQPPAKPADPAKKDDKPNDATTPDDDDSNYEESDGFQEVRAKGKGKPSERPRRERAKKHGASAQLTQQQIQNIPPLMATLVGPPAQMAPKAQSFDRSRQNKIPPRFAKQREIHRLQRMHQHQNPLSDIDLKAPLPNRGFNLKNTPPMVNAWDKPLTTQLRNDDNLLGVNIDKPLEVPTEEMLKSPVIDKGVLDGATPPVHTIIFENTNFKSAPGRKPADKLRKGDELPIEPKEKPDAIQLDGGDMKLDFLDSELTHLTDEKASKTSVCAPPAQAQPGAISTAESLNFKIQSVKKVWETDERGGDEAFTTSFEQGALDASAFVKQEDDSNEHAYSANQQTSNNTTNICKVKPTQQISGGGNVAAASAGSHQPHSGGSGMLGPGLMGNPLSPPPPMQPVIGGLGQPPHQQQPYASSQQQQQHLGYGAAGLGGGAGGGQYGMSAIPSPPSVLPYTQQTLQAAQTASLYGAFQIDQLGGQGRSQYSQYPNHYGLGQAGSSPYSAQSMFLQTAQAHATPSAPPPPELYQNMSNYRLSTATPFGQNQQMSNPSTVLISSSSNSLMSASVKPSSQQISAIGTKAGGVGQAYQQQSQQGQQMYMAAFDPSIPANYLQGAGVLQRPGGPVQSNVVPTIPPSSSYYSGSTGTAKPFNCPWRF